MGKLSEMVKGVWDKFRGFSKAKQIGISVLTVALLLGIIALFIYTSTTKYGVLFSGLSSDDSKSILNQLNSDKVSTKVQGTSILVPKSQVDSLRLKYASNITNGSKGFELFDNTSKFGMTDQEMDIQYQRALEGEIERTIKSFPQVKDARVHIVTQQDSAFVKDQTPAKASITLMLKDGQSLSNDQVRSVVALVCGSVKGLTKDNVDIVDNKMKLLTQGLYDNNSDGTDISETATAAQKQQTVVQQREKDLEQQALSVVEPIFGNGKVKVKVNADLDFDAQTKDSTVVDPRNVLVSQNTKKSTTTSNGTQSSAQSPQNANSNTSGIQYPSTNNGNAATTSTDEESTSNYDTGKSTTKTVVAPGTIKRLTASVMVDGKLDQQTKTSIQNSVAAAIGLDPTRGDTINVDGMSFDTSYQNNAQKDIKAINDATVQATKTKIYAAIGIGTALVVALIIGAIIMRKRSNKDDLEGVMEDEDVTQSIDVTVGDDGIQGSKEQVFKPIDFEPKDENSHIEKEIKKYATEKPDQVIDIIKAWLADDER